MIIFLQDKALININLFFTSKGDIVSKINQFREKKAILEGLKAELDALSNDEGLLYEMEFEEKLRTLMGEYNKSLRDINAILNPQAFSVQNSRSSKNVRKPRKTKRYTNHHNGQVIETKGGNNKVLKEWKQTWGNAEVESWAVVVD